MLGRRIVGPRDVVLATDEALDSEKSDVKAYQDALFDFSSGHMVVRDGMKPTVFRVGPLTEAQKRTAKGLDQSSPEWSDYVFRCGIYDVKNYLVINGESESEVTTPDRKDRPGIGEMASIEWLEQSKIALTDIETVAMIAWIISEARPPLSRLSGPPAGG